MARSFSPATAEQVADAVESIVANGGRAEVELAARFADIPEERAEAALKLGADLGFLVVDEDDGDVYSLANPLGHFLTARDERKKSAVIRIALESYQPFVTFRDRLSATGRAADAAEQTKALLDLDAHASAIRETLVGLGTYARALEAKGGGQYETASPAVENPLKSLVSVADDLASARALVREQLGPDAVGLVDDDEVIQALAQGLIRAQDEDPDGAVLQAGNAVESYLERLADRVGIDIEGDHGINAKLETLQTEDFLPKKLKHVGKYLGHIRNAGDHGVDQEEDEDWSIRESTGIEYVLVACSFIAAITSKELGDNLEV